MKISCYVHFAFGYTDSTNVVVLQCFSLRLQRIKDFCVKISINESMKCQKLEEFVKVDVKQIGRRNMRS